MGFHRKLASDSEPPPCELSCKVPPFCLPNCYQYCFDKCPERLDLIPPPPPPTIERYDDLSKVHHKISKILVTTISIFAAAFFIVCCYAIYAKFISGWLSRRRRRGISQQQETEVTHDDFFDEEHGPIVDNFVWYIRTDGLRQSIISKITACKYKKGEGLIEGTECSVCLSEFEEDEDLRLLPKCNHAFHLPCIDTWLRSHTNCPMCRAPIVTNPSRFSSQEAVVVDPGSVENTQMEIVENSGEINPEMEIRDLELRNEGEEDGQLRGVNGGITCERSNPEIGITQPRRSISLDSSSAAKINLALSTVLAVESDGNSRTGSKRFNGNKNLSTAKASSSSSRARSMQCESSSMKRSLSYHGKNLRSWYGRSQRKPSVPLRSF